MYDPAETWKIINEMWRNARCKFYHENRRAILTISRYSGMHIARVTTKLFVKSNRPWLEG